jgi:hypothetical protein
MVNEVSITIDPLAKLMQDIAERGRRIHDRVPAMIEAGPATEMPAGLKVIDGRLAMSGVSSTRAEPS